MSASSLNITNIAYLSHENGDIIFQACRNLKTYEEGNPIEDEDINTIVFYYRKNGIYDYWSRFMVSQWGIEDYFNYEKFKLVTLNL